MALNRRVNGTQEAAKCPAGALEPIMAVEVVTPEDFLGDVMGDLNSKEGASKKRATSFFG